MSQKEKQYRKIKNNPKDVTFDELVSLLQGFGFTIKNFSGGSHYTVEHSIPNFFDVMESHSIPNHKPTVKVPYVKKVIEWIERVIQYEKQKTND